jgi:hypothetical protein
LALALHFDSDLALWNWLRALACWCFLGAIAPAVRFGTCLALCAGVTLWLVGACLAQWYTPWASALAS